MKIIKLSAIVIVALFLTSCSSSKLLSSHSTSTYDQSSIAPVLVVGIAKNETKRRIYEDTFIDSLNLSNTKAIASYTASKQSIEPNQSALKKIIEKTGAKTILITHMVGSNEKDFYVPSNRIIGTNSYSSGLYGYYPFIHGYVNSSGSYVNTTKVMLETSLYDVVSEKLIWTARSESIDPVMTRKYYQELIDLFLGDLEAKNLL